LHLENMRKKSEMPPVRPPRKFSYQAKGNVERQRSKTTKMIIYKDDLTPEETEKSIM